MVARLWAGRATVVLVLMLTCWASGCSWLREFDYGRGARIGGGDPMAGKVKLRKFSCTSCHVIPGIADADGRSGPALNGWGRRKRFLNETVENSRENLVRWIINPASVKPSTNMPAMNMNERDAHDMAAYLFSINK